MDFSEAVQWWEEWQLRVLVLCSLFLQYFLFVAASLRKYSTPPWLKFLTWLAYLGGDAVAIYALATLFTRHRKEEWVSTHRGSVKLELLWAPILLLHLGGQDGITAYNIEDNELWRRHVLTAVSQITVAIYVFRKSWSGDIRLLQAAILIFVPGVLKCMEKPWALKNASITSIVNITPVLEVFTYQDETAAAGINSLDEYVGAAAKCVREANEQKFWTRLLRPRLVRYEPYNLFVDLPYSFSDRLRSLKHMARRRGAKVQSEVQSSLSKTFERLYTRYQVISGINCSMLTSRGCCGTLLRVVVRFLTFAAIGLFHKSDRQAYNSTDVKITYILLCCTVALEYISTGMKPYWDCYFRFKIGRPWPEQAAQYSLLGYLARNRRHKGLRKLASLLVCKDYLDQLWCMRPCKSTVGITELVHSHVTDGWQHRITSIASYRSFNDSRGQCTLDREKCTGRTLIDESLGSPFDESVILWHLATEFCYYHGPGEQPADEFAGRSREMSNYMAYLLFVNPEMLMAGARRSLFKDAYAELKGMVEEDPSPVGELQLAKTVIQKLEGSDGGEGLVHRGWALAQDLVAIDKEDQGEMSKMWRVIQGVWVEMLCFSAGRSRGYLHAKSLGKGGEYLSYVWLLLAFMGMETLAERLQRTELPKEGDKGAAHATTAPSATPDAGDEIV